MNKKGSSETTREAFCFDLYESYKPQHIKTLDFNFLTFFIGFSEGEATFHSWMDGKTQRAGFSIDQKDSQILFHIKKNLGFGTIKLLKTGYWRFAIWDKTNLFRLYCVFLGNIVLDKKHLAFERWSSLSSHIIFPKDFSIPNDYKGYVERNKISGANLINLNNSWFAGFFQASVFLYKNTNALYVANKFATYKADGGFYISDSYAEAEPFKVTLRLRVYITQLEEVDALKRIGFLFTKDPDRKFEKITNGRTKTNYNRISWATEDGLKQAISYFKRFSLKSGPQLAYLRFCRIFNLRTKIKAGEIILSAKSIKKLKRIVLATKKQTKTLLEKRKKNEKNEKNQS